jgi:glycosyltransferase involved in cell wall biosynthesis
VNRTVEPAQSSVARRMRALWLADKLGYEDRIHGLGRYYLTLMPHMQETDVVPAVLRSTDGLAREFESRGVRLVRLQYGRLDPRTVVGLVRLIRRQRIDLVHLHGLGASTFGRLAARLTGTVAILHVHDTLPAPAYARLADRVLRPLTARSIAVSEFVKRHATAYRYLLDSEIDVLMNPIVAPAPLPPDELERFRRVWRLPDRARLLGTLTRFRAEKGVKHLVAAMPLVLERVPDALLLLWGDGPDRSRLEAQAAELGVEARVRFVGFQTDAPSYLPLLDCFVLPSLSEGLGYAVMEAMVAGLPIVATRVGGIPELVRDGEQALLVEPANPEALAEALTRVLLDRQLAGRLSGAAREAALRHTVERHARTLERLYREALGR